MKKPTNVFKAITAIVWKDLRAEFRSIETLSAMLVFALLAILLFSFALDLDATGREASAAGILWVTLIFSGTLGLGRSLGREKDHATLDGLLLAPISRSALYFGKLLGNFVFIASVAIILLGPMSILFDVSFFRPLVLGVLLLGILGYAGVGTLIASMAVYGRGREVLLPVLLLPIALSILNPAVQATRGLLEGLPLDDLSRWMSMLLGITVIYITLSFMLFDFVVEE